MNKQSGDMYGFVTHTWNVIKGKCSHDCCYCYMKRFPQKDLWFDEKEFKTDLEKGNIIFVGSSTDMFAKDVPESWIKRVLAFCLVNNKNTYLFQTKNPERFYDFEEFFGDNIILGITLETNRENDLGRCDKREYRASDFQYFSENYKHINKFKTMVTIEPIMQFDLEKFVSWIKDIKPDFINIGADSNNKKSYSFQEPSKEDVLKLVEELREFTEIKKKDNLKRLLK
jgi:DNA repair photolyase